MGRYSSAKAYGDNTAQMRSISYEQASGSAKDKPGSVTAEKVHNPYGSTAGAGSGEFHVYRHARAREAERWKQINEEEKEKMLDKEYQEKLAKNTTEEEQKIERRRRKRQRAKEAKLKKKNLKISGVNLSGEEEKEKAENEDDEFTYIPISNKIADARATIDKIPSKEKLDEESKAVGEAPIKKVCVGDAESKPIDASLFPNDGSFLELMKKKLAKSEGDKQPLKDL